MGVSACLLMSLTTGVSDCLSSAGPLPQAVFRIQPKVDWTPKASTPQAHGRLTDTGHCCQLQQIDTHSDQTTHL